MTCTWRHCRPRTTFRWPAPACSVRSASAQRPCSPPIPAPSPRSRPSPATASRSPHWCRRWPSCGPRPASGSRSRRRRCGCCRLAAPNSPPRTRATLTSGLQQVFGMAEGLLNYTRLDDPLDVVETTQGRPLSEADELRVVDEAGTEVPEGELLVRGPYTFNGYFRDDAANERSFTPGGFYRTGDRVRRRADGNLEVTGRVKDVIHRAGETVAAADLEEHLLTHPAIRAAAAVPLPDQHLGEKICAAVVFSGKSVTLAELNRYLDDRGVATHTRPDVLVPMTALPTTAIGKLDKKRIAAQLQA